MQELIKQTGTNSLKFLHSMNVICLRFVLILHFHAWYLYRNHSSLSAYLVTAGMEGRCPLCCHCLPKCWVLAVRECLWKWWVGPQPQQSWHGAAWARGAGEHHGFLRDGAAAASCRVSPLYLRHQTRDLTPACINVKRGHEHRALELKRSLREDCTITEKASTRAFSCLKVPMSAFTFKTLLRHYAKQALTPR